MSGEQDKKFLNAILGVPGAGYETITRLKKFFPSYQEAWLADVNSLKAAGIQEKVISLINQARTRVDPDLEMARLEKEGIALIVETEAEFPVLLKEIPWPCRWLYIRGNLPSGETAVAVVGSRKATAYGKEATDHIIAGLAEKSSVIIASGLAVGIDEAAHRAALKYELKTVAVLGSGLDEKTLYPQKNRRLAREIIDGGGALISEYPPLAPPLKQNFIQRNRIISGIAKGTLIVEAAEKSGALITARFALEQDREVLVIPGSIFSPYSRGTHLLLKEGATPVFASEDVIEELNLPLKSFKRRSEVVLTDESERIILQNLDEPRSVDELKILSNISAPDIVSRLSMLELKGLVKNMGGGLWIRYDS